MTAALEFYKGVDVFASPKKYKVTSRKTAPWWKFWDLRFDHEIVEEKEKIDISKEWAKLVYILNWQHEKGLIADPNMKF